MSDDLEARIDALFAGPPDRFIPERDALVKELKASDPDAARLVAALRKPVVPAWVVDRLAHEEPGSLAELAALGERLRLAQRRAMSGADVSELRAAMDERRRLVADLVRRASELLEASGVSPGSYLDAVRGTLEAATVDGEAAALVRSGRLSAPIAPPAAFEGGGLQLLQGGRPARSEPERLELAPPDAGARAAERRRLGRELATAERAEAKAQTAVDRARARLAELDRRRAEAKDEIRDAESVLRGATLERKRVQARIARLD
jgi:hypothetical protein